MIKKVNVTDSGEPFKNNANYCIGTGRLGLALQKEYMDHLKMAQKAMNFRYLGYDPDEFYGLE